MDPSARSQVRDAGHALGSVLAVMPVVGAVDVMPGDGVYERFELGGLQADRAGYSVGVDKHSPGVRQAMDAGWALSGLAAPKSIERPMSPRGRTD